VAVTGTPYLTFVKNQHDGTASVDFDTDTIKVSLHTSTYTPDTDAHDFFNDITNEVSGTGYTAGGATLASKTITKDTANNKVKFDAADTSWTTSTITARYAVVYQDTGNAATSPVIALIDFGADQSTSGTTFLITWHSDGIVNWAT
jgi:hypothetical protein